MIPRLPLGLNDAVTLKCRSKDPPRINAYITTTWIKEIIPSQFLNKRSLHAKKLVLSYWSSILYMTIYMNITVSFRIFKGFRPSDYSKNALTVTPSYQKDRRGKGGECGSGISRGSGTGDSRTHP
uniref:Ig-like domain-containing protein n=1 Tax=Heterorhabditis bacteriophora TaxID=37862 RepID=A0A1I7W741_HETBA